MGVSELEESSMLLDEKLLRFMDQLESLEEKRATLNSLIEQVTLGEHTENHVALVVIYF